MLIRHTGYRWDHPPGDLGIQNPVVEYCPKLMTLLSVESRHCFAWFWGYQRNVPYFVRQASGIIIRQAVCTEEKCIEMNSFLPEGGKNKHLTLENVYHSCSSDGFGCVELRSSMYKNIEIQIDCHSNSVVNRPGIPVCKFVKRVCDRPHAIQQHTRDTEEPNRTQAQS
ncbi:unnamed protein product, partial [Amoebophrya sp. A25]|eukprot:GSA25T00005229001.1